MVAFADSADSVESLPRVGVGVIVLRKGLLLLGKRMGSHGADTWALPGGLLEFGETPAQCAIREVLEETGLQLESLSAGPFNPDLYLAEGRQYVTLFLIGHSSTGEPQTLEPHKCAGWSWFNWSDLPQPLFPPLASLRDSGFSPFDSPAKAS